MGKITTISSVPEFLAEIYKKELNSDNEVLVFRGEFEDNKGTACVPSVFRDEKLQKNECNLYRDAVLNKPMAFKNDLSKFEKLVRMQHYGLATRLLDITSNPLIALYFATEKELRKDRFVFFKTIQKNILKSHDGEIVKFAIKQIALNEEENKKLYTPEEFKRFSLNIYVFFALSDAIDFFPTYLEEIRTKPISEIKFPSDFLKDLYLDAPEDEDPKETESYFIETKNNFEKRIKNDEIFKFLNEGLSDRHFLEKCLSYIDEIYIQPPKNNERLTTQSGLVIFSHKNNNTKNNWGCIEITNKENIIKELKLLNINRSTIYPDLSNTCEYIKDEYKSKGLVKPHSRLTEILLEFAKKDPKGTLEIVNKIKKQKNEQRQK